MRRRPVHLVDDRAGAVVEQGTAGCADEAFERGCGERVLRIDAHVGTVARLAARELRTDRET